MTFDHAAAENARNTYTEQAARFQAEAAAYRDQAAATNSPEDKRSFLEAAKTLEGQASRVREIADAMQQQTNDKAGRKEAISFEEAMAEARERGKKRGRGDEGVEIE